MKTNQIKQQEEVHTNQNYSLVIHLLIGVFVGFLVTLPMGIFIDDISLGIIVGPPLGIGIGFAIHTYANRNNDDYTRQQYSVGVHKIGYSMLILGICILMLILIYTIF